MRAADWPARPHVVTGGLEHPGSVRPMRETATMVLPSGAPKGKETLLQALFPMCPLGLPSEPSVVVTHTKCLGNEVACLRDRVLMACPIPEALAVSQFAVVMRTIAQHIVRKVGYLTRYSRGRVLRHMAARHGLGLYGPACASLQSQPLTSLDARVKMFVKVEKHLWDGVSPPPCPRAIQYRGPRFNLEVGRYLLPIEGAIYAYLREDNELQLYTSKGVTPRGRAELIVRLWDRYASPAALCIDASRFDAHVRSEHLSAEHRIYQAFFPGDHYLQWLCHAQRRNAGEGQFGTRYQLIAGRMSGDVNTALGNTLIQLGVLATCVGAAQVSILAEGDDALVFGNRQEILRLATSVPAAALRLGFSLKVALAESLDSVEYCSGSPVELRPGQWDMLRAFPKPLITDCWSPRLVHGEEALARKARATAVCYALAYDGHPLYAAWARYALSWTRPVSFARRSWDPDLWPVKTGVVAERLAQHGAGPMSSREIALASDVAVASAAIAWDLDASWIRSAEDALQRAQGPWPDGLTPLDQHSLRSVAGELLRGVAAV